VVSLLPVLAQNVPNNAFTRRFRLAMSSESNCYWRREVVLQLDRAQDRRTLSEEEMAMRRELKGLCLGLASPERTIARQIWRITYLREGDANTKFFHLHVTIRRRRNHIASLHVDGIWTTRHA
jgi:hypothetical protein